MAFQRLLWILLCVCECAEGASWRELKAVRKSPSEHGEPWRRFGAWRSISGASGNNAWANVVEKGLRDGEGWYGDNSSLWTHHLSLYRTAGVRRLLFHLPFGKITGGHDMEFTRYIRCQDGYPGVHEPLPWLTKNFTDAMLALKKMEVSVVIYYGTMNCFRPRGDSLLCKPFREIEPHWNLTDPSNPATSGYYKHPDPRYPYSKRGAFNVSKSPRHAALVEEFRKVSEIAEARQNVQGWVGVMHDISSIRSKYKGETAEFHLLTMLLRSLTPLAEGNVDGLALDSHSTPPPESVLYQFPRLLDAHGIEVLLEPMIFGGPSPPEGRWPEGDAWKRFGTVTVDNFWASTHKQHGACKESDVDELGVLQRDLEGPIFNATSWDEMGKQWQSWLRQAANRCPWVHVDHTLGGVNGLTLNWEWLWNNSIERTDSAVSV